VDVALEADAAEFLRRWVERVGRLAAEWRTWHARDARAAGGRLEKPMLKFWIRILVAIAVSIIAVVIG